jgi:nuclear pore complex protein Nup188
MPELIFNKLCLSRADLAFALLQKLIDVSPHGKEAKSILPSVWNALQPHVAELGQSLNGDDSEYVRTLLRILYLALYAHQDLAEVNNSSKDNKASERESTVTTLDILGVVVASGFRSLCTQLHGENPKVQPSDFALLIAIMRSALRVPGVTNHSERLLTYFADERTAQYAGTLLSWSDQLMTDGDPIYGELSLTFLLELSTVPVLAEAIVVSGTFAQVSATTLFAYFRRLGGISPFDNPPRMYNIWSRGYLPLTINILGAIGAPIATEIATTFGQFKPQLIRASNHFDLKSTLSNNANNNYITLSMASEAHSLALINAILNKIREAGSSVGIIPSELPPIDWDASSVREDLENLLQRRNTLRESLVPVDEREEALLRDTRVKGDGGAENRLEAKFVDELNAALDLLASGE